MLLKMEIIFLKVLNKLKEKYPKIIKEVRGKGLLLDFVYTKIKLNLFKS